MTYISEANFSLNSIQKVFFLCIRSWLYSSYTPIKGHAKNLKTYRSVLMASFSFEPWRLHYSPSEYNMNRSLLIQTNLVIYTYYG